MKILIFGLGYVGVTAAACLLKDGHTVVGIDLNKDKVAMVNVGKSPISEPEVGDLLNAGYNDNRLSATTVLNSQIQDADMAMICVGTSSLPNGTLDLSHVRTVAEQLGIAIRSLDTNRRRPFLCVFRSTMPPGSMNNVVLPALLKSAGEEPGKRYEVAFNPEFLRESTAVSDYYQPPKIVIGERTPGITQRLFGIYNNMDAPVFEVAFATAEMVKLMDNTFHGLKVAFANEIGRLCLQLGIDPQLTADIFLSDTKLNISPYYLRPGAPFGGSCLPKDISALVALSQRQGLALSVIEGIMPSNMIHKQFLAQQVMRTIPKGGHILLLGLSFKFQTDDLRESPLVELAETLLGKGYKVSIYEPDLKDRELIGANLQYLQEHLPHLEKLLIDSSVAITQEVDLVVVGKQILGILEHFDSTTHVINVHRLKGILN
jgi:GDP-mannose 6-dehydrogenase